MNPDILQSLMQRGMLEKEAVIYMTTLELANAPASRIARKSQIKRTTAYAILRDFEQRGLATSIMRKDISYFSVIDPQQLAQQLQTKYQQFTQALPALEALKEQYSNKPKIMYYEGLSGMKQVYRDILDDANEHIYACIGATGIHSELEHYLYTENIPMRVERKIFANIIISDSEENRKYAGYDEV
jgi:sugar-specific transcriptional regulator TrmB